MAESTRRVWVCELVDCGHVWLAVAKLPPDKCSKCRRRGWHLTASTVELIRESGAGLEDRMAEIARRVFAEEWARVPAEPVGFAEPEVLPPGRVDVAALRAICAGDVPNVARNVPDGGHNVPAPSTATLCPYRDLPNEAGDIYGCGLDAGHKGRHVPGPKVGDIW